VSISVKVFGSAIHERFEQIQAQLSEVQRRGAGSALGRARRPRVPAEAAEIERFRRSERRVPAPQPAPHHAAGILLSEHGFFLGLGALVVIWMGSRDVISGRITVGQFVAFTRI